jgi:hypothetical protein
MVTSCAPASVFAFDGLFDTADKRRLRPLLGGIRRRFMGDDDDLRTRRVGVVPALGDVEEPPTRDQRTRGPEQPAEDLGAGLVDLEVVELLVGVLYGNVARLIPVEQLADLVVGVRDVAVQRHRHVADDLAHRCSLLGRRRHPHMSTNATSRRPLAGAYVPRAVRWRGPVLP